MTDPNDQAALPEPLVASLDALERELYAVSVAKLLKQRQLSATTAQLALRGLKAYLEGDKDLAIQMFETVAEELRDVTVQIPSP